MVVTQNRPPGNGAPDEDLIDIFITTSVVARRWRRNSGNRWKKEKPSIVTAADGGNGGQGKRRILL